MNHPDSKKLSERRELSERRLVYDRRSGKDRRAPGGAAGAVVTVERRSGRDRRASERRLVLDRRLAPQSSADQLRDAIVLLARIVDGGRLDDEGRRFLDAAVLRLTFVLERLES
jgi:hypothetical protein